MSSIISAITTSFNGFYKVIYTEIVLIGYLIALIIIIVKFKEKLKRSRYRLYARHHVMKKYYKKIGVDVDLLKKELDAVRG